MIIAVTQARISSSRFPGKVLADVDGISLLELHLRRIQKSKLVDAVVVAIADEDGAEKLEEISKSLGVLSYRGSVNDVLDRFYNSVKDLKPDIVIRLTSDCPLIDPVLIDQVITHQRMTDADYCSNVHPPTFPDGLDVEVVKWAGLEAAFREATAHRDREHVMPFIWSRPERFKLSNFHSTTDFSSLRMTVDYPEDLEVIRALVKTIGKYESYDKYIDLLSKENSLRELNENRMRNEALRK